jgi:ATP-dependent Clp protease ATP-binding subunit ClpC
MFDRFSEDAKTVMSRARLEAMRLQHENIDVTHMLLALLRTPTETAGKVLTSLGVDHLQLVTAIEAMIEPGRGGGTSQLPFTPQGKDVLMRAMQCASELGHNFIGTGHLLLGAVAAASGPMQSTLQAGGLQLASLRTALADASSETTTSATTGVDFDLENVTGLLAVMNMHLADFAASAIRSQQFAAADALRELRGRCAATLVTLRKLHEGG